MANDSLPRYTVQRPIRVLHVDDEPAQLEITRVFLKRIVKGDFEMVSVLSAEEALERLENEDFDVIVSDYKMPRMDGIEFLEVVRKGDTSANTPFIIFTGKGGAEVKKEALEKGAERYITKRGSPSTQCSALIRAIYELVQEKKNNLELRERAVNAVKSYEVMLFAGLMVLTFNGAIA